MALRKTLAQRLFNISRISTQTLTNCRISNPAVLARSSPNPSTGAPDPGDNGIFRRFLHRTSMFSPAIVPDLRRLPTGEKLVETLRAMDISRRERVRLDGLTPPVTAAKEGLTVEDAKKLLRVSQMEAVKSRIRRIENSCISYPEFVRICGENCGDSDQGVAIAKALDESGAVIVLGKNVFLRPDQVVKAMEGMLQLPGAIPINAKDKEELEEMERIKSFIDTRAKSQVQRELWCGLGFMLLQTAGFMRLTFWELSWDVMEPICFFVTSMYFLTGYAFFLRTSKEPSFEGFFQSRFAVKQKRLMKKHNFDMERYNELRRGCGVKPWSSPVLDNVSEIAKLA